MLIILKQLADNSTPNNITDKVVSIVSAMATVFNLYRS
jgi:hypothetical protein